eukprot:299870_1
MGCCNSHELPDRDNNNTEASQDALLHNQQSIHNAAYQSTEPTNAPNMSDDLLNGKMDSKRTYSEPDQFKDDDVVGDLNIKKLAKKYKYATPTSCTNSLGILDVAPLGLAGDDFPSNLPNIMPQIIEDVSSSSTDLHPKTNEH